MNVVFFATLRDESTGELVNARVNDLKQLMTFAEELFERFDFRL